MIDKIVTYVKQVLCRHDMLPHMESDRICLKCVVCGHETPGWSFTKEG